MVKLHFTNALIRCFSFVPCFFHLVGPLMTSTMPAPLVDFIAILLHILTNWLWWDTHWNINPIHHLLYTSISTSTKQWVMNLLETIILFILHQNIYIFLSNDHINVTGLILCLSKTTLDLTHGNHLNCEHNSTLAVDWMATDSPSQEVSHYHLSSITTLCVIRNINRNILIKGHFTVYLHRKYVSKYY